jgi:hypothetical protein
VETPKEVDNAHKTQPSFNCEVDASTTNAVDKRAISSTCVTIDDIAKETNSAKAQTAASTTPENLLQGSGSPLRDKHQVPSKSPLLKVTKAATTQILDNTTGHQPSAVPPASKRSVEASIQSNIYTLRGIGSSTSQDNLAATFSEHHADANAKVPRGADRVRHDLTATSSLGRGSSLAAAFDPLRRIIPERQASNNIQLVPSSSLFLIDPTDMSPFAGRAASSSMEASPNSDYIGIQRLQPSEMTQSPQTTIQQTGSFALQDLQQPSLSEMSGSAYAPSMKHPMFIVQSDLQTFDHGQPMMIHQPVLQLQQEGSFDRTDSWQLQNTNEIYTVYSHSSAVATQRDNGGLMLGVEAQSLQQTPSMNPDPFDDLVQRQKGLNGNH